MLLGMFSCKNAPTIKENLKTFVIDQRYNDVAVGKRNLNYKDKKSIVGEWVRKDQVVFIPIHEAPNNLFCITVEDWLTKVKPTLKRASDFYNRR